MGLLNEIAAPTAVETEERVSSIGKVKGAYLVDGGIHDAIIKVAYMDQSKGGALFLNLELGIGEKTVRAQGPGTGPQGGIYITSGTEKGKKTTYIDKNTNEEKPLPGYSKADSLSKLTVGKGFAELDTEKKIIKQYDWKSGADVNVEVDMLTDLVGQKVKAGIIRQYQDIVTADSNWQPTGLSREANVIDKFFDLETGKTIVEKNADVEAEFASKWEDDFKGIVADATSKKIGLVEEGGKKASVELDDDEEDVFV